MARLDTIWLRLAMAVSLALIVAACSSSMEDGEAGTGGRPRRGVRHQWKRRGGSGRERAHPDLRNEHGGHKPGLQRHQAHPQGA